MKLLGLDALVVEDDTTIGQHAINVGKNQLNRATACGEVHGKNIR
jgi:hypothetical protein